MYDVNSKHPEDFINHGEILDTLAYADENKANANLSLRKPLCAKGFLTAKLPSCSHVTTTG